MFIAPIQRFEPPRSLGAERIALLAERRDKSRPLDYRHLAPTEPGKRQAPVGSKLAGRTVNYP
jgi:hypothetical protein